MLESDSLLPILHVNNMSFKLAVEGHIIEATRQLVINTCSFSYVYCPRRRNTIVHNLIKYALSGNDFKTWL